MTVPVSTQRRQDTGRRRRREGISPAYRLMVPHSATAWPQASQESKVQSAKGQTTRHRPPPSVAESDDWHRLTPFRDPKLLCCLRTRGPRSASRLSRFVRKRECSPFRLPVSSVCSVLKKHSADGRCECARGPRSDMHLSIAEG
eukprot:3203491-Prymnesium_polylepis.1